MSSENEAPRNAPPETVRSLAKGLATLDRDIAPILKGLHETAVRLQPLTEALAGLATVAAPFVQAAAHAMERLDIAEGLLKRGWVPNQTTPFDLVAECEDDDTRLQTSLLAYYTDNWPEVRARLELRMSALDVDDEAKATFREALEAHEGGLYRCTSRLLFPEFERVFRGALFDGRAGQIRYHKFVTRLSGDAANLELADFLTTDIQDMVLFKYLTEGVGDTDAQGDHSTGAAPRYEPGLAVGVNTTNVEQAKQSPIPTRHAVAHGLVAYSSRQSSLNAIFIADYVFSVVSRALRNKPELDADNCCSRTVSRSDQK